MPQLGKSELSAETQEDLRKVQELLLSLRKKTVYFISLPAVGGASGADYATAHLQKVWESMRLGHKFTRKKNDVRAFILSADLFPPPPKKTLPSTGPK